MINVTQPSLAPLSEFIPYLERIWASGIMTHNGPLLHELERELARTFGVPDVVCVGNGTAALQLALRALDITGGEVITTPFTFIATANIIRWERCTPVFVDIDPDTWNIDPALIEAAITPQTRAILPVHVFSAPCDVQAIKAIADRHRLKVIYDAAHATAVDLEQRSVMMHGDVSCLSFHATKLFNTCEGGACVTDNPELAARIRRMRFFGFDENKEIVDDGMNAKMTEIAAALGLANLKYLTPVRANRRNKYTLYMKCLQESRQIRFQKFHPEAYNYSYMPVVFDSEDTLLRVESHLKANGIVPRRYFWPSLNTVLPLQRESVPTRRSLPVSERIASRVLCLPLHDQLPDQEIRRISDLVLATLAQ
jgi:dTDP-4-amino-4,6-dideoxygalactose transaminase